jgi:hypothetical protein
MCSATRTTPDALGLKIGVHPVGDLLGESFLNLGPVGEQLHDPGELGQAEYPLARQVGNIGAPDKRQEMMLAQGLGAPR